MTDSTEDAKATRPLPPETPAATVLSGRFPLEVFSVRDQAAFQRLYNDTLAARFRDQRSLLPVRAKKVRLPGFCVICERPTLMKTDDMFAGRDADGRMVPSWRERQICSCGFNCRQRSCVHVLTHLPGLGRESVVYCTEQGALFRHIRQRFPNALGSEYLGDRVPLGARNILGFRNEDLTRLTFGSAMFDCIFSLDVLEHVVDYQAALREMARCLRPGGWLLLTTPVHFGESASVQRASFHDGALVHHLPAVYHGDPIDPKGALCFHDFGWDLLPRLSEAGLSDVNITVFTAPHFGYVGLQYAILSRRTLL